MDRLEMQQQLRDIIANAVRLDSPSESVSSNQPPLWLAHFGEHGDTLAQLLMPEGEATELVESFQRLQSAIRRASPLDGINSPWQS